MIKTYWVLALCLSTVLTEAQITPGFQPGNICVLRAGNGTDTLASSGDPIFLDEYTPAGVLTNSVAIPGSGSNALLISGTASSEGAISRSANSNFIVVAGYNTSYPYTSSLSGSKSSEAPRGIATIDFNGNYTFITNTSVFFSGNNMRCGATDGSNNFWAVGAVSGTVYMGLAMPQATVQSGMANNDVIQIFNGNLYYSEHKNIPYGVYSMTGLPVTTNGSAAVFITTSVGTNSSPYGFAVNAGNTIAYVADDETVATGGGIQKYTKSAGTWGLAYTLGTGAGSTNGTRGIVASFGEPAVIYATTAGDVTNSLIVVFDTNSSAVATTLASAGANEVFRGVQFTPQGSGPAVTIPLQSQIVEQGQNAGFSVTATGSGTLYYQWESNSAAITGWETNASLTLSTSNYALKTYPIEVLISNSWGTNSSSGALTVNASNVPPPAPVITVDPASIAVNAGSTAVFAGAATGSWLVYQWQMNHSNLTDSALIAGSSTTSLTLSNVFGASAGSYTLMVTNAGGATNSTPGILTVADPYLVLQPAGQTFLAGATISLQVGAIGTQLTCQWTLDNTNIPGATNSLFQSSNAVAAETGSYAAVITGTYGAVTSATVNIIVAATQTTFFPSNLVVLRVGTGTQTLVSSGNTLFLDQFGSNGAYVSTMYLPDSGPSALLISGVATSEGCMTLSGDGRLLAIAGYNAALGAMSGSLSSSLSSNVPRVIGTIDGMGAYKLGATTSARYSGLNLRAGATDGANNFWGAGSGNGTWYFGNATNAGSVQTSVTNTRVINVENGALLFSAQSGTNGLYSLGALPTGTAVTNMLFATGPTSNPEDFAMNAASNLAYIADDSTTGGGIQRWQYSSGAWTNAYTVSTGADGAGARSLAANFSGAHPVIYAITTEAASNRLIAITDAGASSVAVTLATCASNEWFRAVKFAPVLNPFPAPELSAAALGGGQFSFSVGGVAGYQYLIESSANLTTWQPLQTNAAPFTFTQTNAGGFSQQYFRAVYVP